MILQYKNYLGLQGQSDNTIRVYISRIEYLLSKISVEQLSTDNINNFLLEIKKEKSVSTLNGYLNAIKSFLQFLKKDISLPNNFKTDKKLSKYFTEEYLEKEIISTINSRGDDDILKLKAIIYFLFYSGIRIGEIDFIKRENFTLEKNIVKIYVPKTKEERIAVYTDKAKEAMKLYFDSEVEITNAFNISASGIQSKFRRLKEEFEDINFHPHLFRHSFAMYCLKIGMDISEVSKLLGHHSLNTTMRYIGHDINQIQEKFLKKTNERITKC
jgi:integrase